jgi:monovalent cation:H+ antiporter-2, CPA2 family
MVAESLSNFKDVLIVLGTAGIAIPLLKRFGISTILGFLLIGIVLGPHVLGVIATALPSLQFLSPENLQSNAAIAELGVVFLLFLIGLELSPERLLTMKRLVFGLGGLQIIFSMALITAIAHLLGFDDRTALVLGMALSLSSTAIVIQLFSDEKRLGSQAGRVSFAILLMQDLAIIPMLLLLGILAEPTGGNLFTSISLALVQAVAAIAFIVIVGRYALRPMLKMVSSAQSPDLFMAAVLFIAIGTGALATAAGLSMSLGAFIAGLMLAETEYRRAVEAIIEPFKGLLLGLFFLLVGLGLDLSAIAHQPILIMGAAILLVLAKAVLIYALARAFRIGHTAAIESALLLGPCGEFAFVILGSAQNSGVANDQRLEMALLVVSISMAILPVLSKLSKPIVRNSRNATTTADLSHLPKPSPSETPRVIIAGFGRVGTLIASMLDEHKLPYIAIDNNVDHVANARKDGYDIYYGDATNPGFLHTCGISTSLALAVTMDNPVKADEVVKAARKENPTLKIIARARDERHAMKLYLAGVTEAVPETIESSLQLGEALLVETGIPMGLAIASVHERRDTFRKLLGRPNRREELQNTRRKLRNRMPKA